MSDQESIMRKRDELADPKSCLNLACDDELIFVLLARDSSAAHAVRCWVQDRIRTGMNTENDPKIIEALDWAQVVHGVHTGPI